MRVQVTAAQLADWDFACRSHAQVWISAIRTLWILSTAARYYPQRTRNFGVPTFSGGLGPYAPVQAVGFERQLGQGALLSHTVLESW
jgi:hypothetical protein